MSDHFNKLTPAEAELLALLAEECGEVVQIVGKILRHGLNSFHPEEPSYCNRDLLQKELGHVQAAITMMEDIRLVDIYYVNDAENKKIMTVKQWLHHQDGSNV
jgi:hypothetical protein